MTRNPRATANRGRPDRTPTASLRRLLVLACALFTVMSLGCVKSLYQSEVCKRPDANNCIIEDVAVSSEGDVPASSVKEKIATGETSRVLGGAMQSVPIMSVWDRLTVDYSRLDPFVLERDLARVERFYRSVGFYEAHASAARVLHKSDGKIRVEIAVDEGTPVTIGSVSLEWKDWDKEKGPRVMLYVLAAETKLLKQGKNFEEDPYEQTKKLLVRALSDHGFAYAEVEGKTDVDLVKHEAKIVYSIKMGPHCVFGPIHVTGLGDLPEAPLRASLDLVEGEEYSTAKLDSAQIALANFGVLGAVDVVSKTSPVGQPPDPVVPVDFKAQKTQLRTIRLGVGGQVGDVLEAHGIIGWENRNFFGGLRHFTIDVEPGFIFYPVTINNIFTTPPTAILPEVLVRAELRQPLWFSPRTWGVLGGSFNFYRLQTADTVNQDPVTYGLVPGPHGLPQLTRIEENVVGYREVAGRIGAERVFWDNRQYIGAFYNIQLDNPFSYNLDAPPPGFLNFLVISYLDLVGTLDLRKNAEGKPDKLHPHSGTYFSTDFQVAGHFLGGTASDFRIKPEFRGYIPLSKRVTIAYRLTVGLLFPENYGQSLKTPFGPCSDNATVDDNRAKDLQILQFRAFFSGGPNSNRGYPYNGVGPQEDSHFLLANSPCFQQVVATGGLTLWEQSAELRFPIVGALGGVWFVDGSDVTRETGLFRLDEPHVSTGLGLRYDTPVGPLRVDLGYRIPCLQVVGTCATDVPLSEGQGSILTIQNRPQGSFGIPFALSIAIGEAF